MLEIYDCTLREGEQTQGVHFSVEDRLEIAKKLDEFGMSFIELGWPISSSVLEAFLKLDDKLKEKVVAFGSTSLVENPEEDINLKSIVESQVKYACIFGKTWIEHVEKQLRITKEENLEKIEKSVRFLKNKGINVFYDAEHYFDGFKNNPKYALETLKAAVKGGAFRLILCDTNGGTLPEEVKEILIKTKRFLNENNLNVGLGVHFHNDSALALTNSLESLPYIEHIQGTINGLGERVGNLDFCEFIPLLYLKKGYDFEIKLNKLKELGDLVYKKANLPRKFNQAFISQRAFSHKGGVHIDATSKGASYGHIPPEVLGLNHNFILTSLGGAACVVEAAKKFGFNLEKKDEKTKNKIKEVLDFLKKTEKQGYDLGDIDAEQFIIIHKFFRDYKEFFKIKKWEVKTNDNKSESYLKLDIKGEEKEITKEVQGSPIKSIYDTLKEELIKKYPRLKNLGLLDYRVRVVNLKGGRSPVRTRVVFSNDGNFSLVGVSENIIESGLEAIEKAFNYYLNKTQETKV